jgi:hypothetical protein
LASFLDETVFAGNTGMHVKPDAKDAAGFAAFMECYKEALSLERSAGDRLR